MSNTNNNRRDFLKTAGLGLLAVTAAAKVITQSTPALAADAGNVDPKDSAAAALGYVADAKKVDTKKWPKRAGAEGANQFCNNCMFFQGKDAGKPGPCQIFAGKNVANKGWCNSWTAKPKA